MRVVQIDRVDSVLARPSVALLKDAYPVWCDVLQYARGDGDNVLEPTRGDRDHYPVRLSPTQPDADPDHGFTKIDVTQSDLGHGLLHPVEPRHGRSKQRVRPFLSRAFGCLGSRRVKKLAGGRHHSGRVLLR